MIEPHNIFVGSSLALRRRAPAALEIGAIPNGKNGVSVIGIYGEEHVASFTRQEKPRQRRSAGVPPRGRAGGSLHDRYRESGHPKCECLGGPGWVRRV